jgi:hypothetical protein
MNTTNNDPFAHLSESDRSILREFIQTYASHEWLRGANIIENHPLKMRKTLEIAVNYKPMYEMNKILEFSDKHKLALHMFEVKEP